MNTPREGIVGAAEARRDVALVILAGAEEALAAAGTAKVEAQAAAKRDKEPCLGSVAGVDQIDGFTAAAGREELSIRRGGVAGTPETRHRQGRLCLHHHGSDLWNKLSARLCTK